MLRVLETPSAEQRSRIRKKTRTHRIALAGDRVRAGSGPADVAGEQREIDERLRDARGLVALVHAHRPPERNGAAARDRRCERADVFRGEPGFLGATFWRETVEEARELDKPRRVPGEEFTINPSVPDQLV